jgi:hypothetical protein
MSKTGVAAVVMYVGLALWMRRDAARGEWGPLSELVAGLAVAPVTVPLELVRIEPSVQSLAVWIPMFLASAGIVYAVTVWLTNLILRLVTR